MTNSLIFLYKFQSASTAEKVLSKKAFRLSRFKQLNDPFELFAISLRDRQLREKYRAWVAEFDSRYGMISFSYRNDNPVLWSHYSDNHAGVCIEFHVAKELIWPIKYVGERLFYGFTAKKFLARVTRENSHELVFTKYNHWQYEEEARIICKLSDCKKDGEYFFEPFSDQIQPKKLYLGPRYISKSNPALQDAAQALNLKIITTRMAFGSFSICAQKNKKFRKLP